PPPPLSPPPPYPTLFRSAARGAEEPEHAAEGEAGEREARNARGRRVERRGTVGGDERLRARHEGAAPPIAVDRGRREGPLELVGDRKSTRLNSSHVKISY